MSKPVDGFSRWYYRNVLTRRDTQWLGTCVVKNPLDLFYYQEILWDTRPTLIVETGSFMGGSALYLADILNLIGEGRVISIDLEIRDLPTHPSVQWVQGESSAHPAVVSLVEREAKDEERVMVILDSHHSAAHVLKELNLYHRFVTPGCFLVVEDTNRDGYWFAPDLGDGQGPAEALKAWQPRNRGFQSEESPFGFSLNPGGWLRRIRR